MTAKPDKREKQSEAFIRAARELGCEDDEAAFREKLRRIARAKPEAKSTKKVKKKD